MDMVNYKKWGIILAISFLVYILITQIIYFTAPNQATSQFPTDCEKETNCTRVAETNVRGEGLVPLVFNTSIAEVHDKIQLWIEKQPRTTILTNNDEFIHAVFVTAFFRFHDDFYTSIYCDNNQVKVYTQSESRVGQGDLSVNENRVRNFYLYIQNIDFPTSTC